jgi:hypothetical protein
MRRIVVFAAFLIAASFSLAANSAYAWSAPGHRTICEIAYRNLTHNSRSALGDLMNSWSGGVTLPAKKGKGGSTPERTYTTFTYGCLEEDTRPRAHEKDHFINVFRDTAHITNACPPTTPGGSVPTDCIISAIDRAFAILSDPSKSQSARADALMAIGHWVGDIHQPLHVSYRDDAGGNGLAVNVTGKCLGRKPDKFHAVWDDCLVNARLFDRARRSLLGKGQSTKPTSLPYEAAALLHYGFPLDQEIALVSSKPWQWAEESYLVTIAPQTLYCVRNGNRCVRPQTQPVTIDQGYIDRYSPYVEERIRAAGYRLAHLVNQALDPQYPGPKVNEHGAD